MSTFQRGDVWWYEFWFAGRRIRESSKSESKTVAKTAEKNRRRELEEGFNNIVDVRRERIRLVRCNPDLRTRVETGRCLRSPSTGLRPIGM